MAQSTYRSIDSAIFVLNSATSMVINKPSGVVDGDLLICAIYIADGSGSRTVTPPVGWTSIRNDAVNSNQERLETYYKIASSEPSNYTFTKSASIDACAGAIIRVDTFDTSTPIDTNNGAGTAGANTNSLTFADTVTPTLANELMLFIVHVMANTHSNLTDISTYAVTNNNPSWTEILDMLGNPASPSGTYNFAIAYANRASTSATGNSSASSNGGIGPNRYIAQKIVIRNQTLFSSTINDTVVDTDTVTQNYTTRTTINETVIDTDSVDSDISLVWVNDSKSPTPTWINENK